MNVFNKATTVAETKYVHDKLQGEIDIIAGVVKVESWSDVQKIVRAGMASKIFSIGDQLTCQRDGIDLVWDIIGIDHDTPADPQFTHSMTLQLHDCFPTTIQFDEKEAFYYAETAIPAGTYHFKIDPTAYTSDNTFKDTGYQFTLTQAVPAGGQLTFPWALGTQASTAKVSSYESASATTAIESSVIVTSGTGGQGLGTLVMAGDFSNNLNAIQRFRYGSNNYKESAIRQWINSDKAAGSVWTPQTKFDRPPTWAATADGFMYGMDTDFLAVLGKTHIVVSHNRTVDGGGYDEMNDYFFLLSRREVYMGDEVGDVIEGEPYPYYSDYSDLSAHGTGADSNRIKYRNGGAALNWWNRTPFISDPCDVRTVATTGSMIYKGAYNSDGVAPACNII